MSNALIWFICATTVAYLVRVLLFDGSKGPFESLTKFVVDNGTHEGPVNFFDYARRLFGAYRVEDAGEDTQIWRTTVRMDVWRCPRCLSCWVAFLVSVPFTISMVIQDPWAIILFPCLHFSIVFCAQLLVFIQLKIEG